MKKHRTTKPRHVLLTLCLSYSTHRGFLAGVTRYLKRNPNWHVTVAENFSDFDDASMDEIVKSGFDGIITIRPRTATGLAVLANAPIPIAVLGTSIGALKTRARNAVFVRGNDHMIGNLAARHFMSLGRFRAYAFIRTGTDITWSRDRNSAFTSALRRKKIDVTTISTPFLDGSREDIDSIGKQLQALPKPVAVMAAYDNRALHVLQACQSCALAVPHHVSVIGVDNDSVLCDFSRPTLTSISTRPDIKGEQAAAELERLMARHGAAAKTILVSNATIVERESTAPVSPSSHLIERAIQFIEANACTGIKARDVIAHLGVSRTLADKRFRDHEAHTIRETLAKVRIEEVKRLLRETKMPIARITSQCGFASGNYAKRLFRNMVGMTMREWRAHSASAPLRQIPLSRKISHITTKPD